MVITFLITKKKNEQKTKTNAERSCSSTWVSLITQESRGVFVNIIVVVCKVVWREKKLWPCGRWVWQPRLYLQRLLLDEGKKKQLLGLTRSSSFMVRTAQLSFVIFCAQINTQCNIFRVTGNSLFVSASISQHIYFILLLFCFNIFFFPLSSLLSSVSFLCFLYPGKESLRTGRFQSSEARLQKYQWYWSEHEWPSVHQAVVPGE